MRTDEQRAYDRTRYQANVEARRAASRKYYHANSEKACAKAALWDKRNPGRRSALYKKAHLKRYGLTLESFEDLWFRQGFVCASCGEEPASTPHIDHCHTTGRVRGLLCSGCNVALGHAKDSPKRLRALADYIEKYVSTVDTSVETI